MSEVKVNSIKGVGASVAAISIDNADGTCTANITNNLSNRNLIINGAMTVAQRDTSSTSSGIATVDRFGVSTAGLDEAMTQAQVDVDSGTTPYSLGFRKAYKITNGNQTGGAGTSDRCIVFTAIESQDNANAGWNYTSASSYTTLSFWAKSSVAQTFYLALTTQDGTQQRYGAPITFSSTNTWTKFTYKIPGNSNIQFDNNNDRGLQIYWTLFRGTDTTDNSFPINQWAAYNSSIRYPDITSTWFTTNDATFELTGVQLEVGSVATDFEHKSYAQELERCKRYYQLWVSGTLQFVCFGDMYTATQCDGGVQLPVEMRATPTIEANTGNDYYIIYTNSGDSHIDGNLISFRSHKRAVLWYAALDDSGQTAGHAVRWVTENASSKIAFSAEI